MPIQNYLFLSLICLSILISSEAGLYLIFRYRTELSRWAGLLLFGQALEVVGYLLQWTHPPASLGQFFYMIQVLGFSLFCIFWLLFVFVFTQHPDWIRPRNLALLLALPGIYLLMMIVLWLQGAPSAYPGAAVLGSLVFSPFANGLPGALFIIFIYGVALFSNLVLLRFFSRSDPTLRKLLLPLLTGPNLLAMVAGLELAGIHPLKPISIHQLAIASICLIAFWAVFDLRFGSVLSSARETVIDQMQDGVLILNQQDQFIDLNAAAQRIFSHNSKNALKQPLSQIWPEGAALIGAQTGTQPAARETRLQVDGLENTYDINISQLLDAYRKPVGRVIVLRNVTEKELMEKVLKERTLELQHTNTFLAKLAEAMINIQKTVEPARVLDMIGRELHALGLMSFIAQLEPTSNELVVSFLYTGKSVLASIEKLLGIRVIGFRLKRDQFLKLYNLLEGKEKSYRDQLIKGITSFDDQEFSQKVTQVMRMIGLKLDSMTIVVPLVSEERVLGLMGVWGDDLHETDIPPLNMFASQVAWTIERADLHAAETRRALELARVNRLVTTLSAISSHAGATSNTESMLETLGSELRGLGLDCGVVSLDPAGKTATIKYLSFNPALIQAVEKLTGLSTKNYSISKDYWPDDTVAKTQIPAWYASPGDMLRGMFPQVPASMAKQSLKLLGFKPQTQLCMLPLVIREQLIGAMLIWGPDLHPADGTILEVFASQVAGILQNAHAIEIETRRANELARSNAIILALSNVAARLDTTSDLAQVFNTLGSELKKVGVNCMVGTIDSAQQTIKVEYLSISDEIAAWTEKLSIFWPAEILIPRRLWPTDKAISEKTPYWDPNMLESTVKMFPYIPKQIFISSLEKAGMHPNDPICYLPMINEEDVIGILTVWGSNLKHDDVPGFSVFANQVATAIRNTRLYDQAQQEILERTQAQARIKAALGEKEVLLKEVHHRVKNNLQIISSLLNLQANQINDQKTRDTLRDSQNRVRTMALIHEKLYQSPDLEQVDFAAYLKGLVNFLAQSYRANSNQVLIKAEAQNIYLDIDSAIPCGLIVNELVSNSLKYAFPENRAGTIGVSCQQSSEGEVVLIVRDDGAGLPAGFDPTKSSSLGLKLVTSLAQQLNGKLEMENLGGLSFRIAFPIDQ